jgi:hypothetical protein
VTGSLRLSVRTTASHVVKAGSTPAGITKILYFLHIFCISSALGKRMRERFPFVASGGAECPLLAISARHSYGPYCEGDLANNGVLTSLTRTPTQNINMPAIQGKRGHYGQEKHNHRRRRCRHRAGDHSLDKRMVWRQRPAGCRGSCYHDRTACRSSDDHGTTGNSGPGNAARHDAACHDHAVIG